MTPRHMEHYDDWDSPRHICGCDGNVVPNCLPIGWLELYGPTISPARRDFEWILEISRGATLAMKERLVSTAGVAQAHSQYALDMAIARSSARTKSTRDWGPIRRDMTGSPPRPRTQGAKTSR